MDFLERMGGQIGERYLMNKANAAPQQVESLVKKQFKGNTKAETNEAGKKSAEAEQEGHKTFEAGSSEKNEEILRLREQLAQAKLEKGAATAAEKKSSGTGKVSKERKGLEDLGAGAGIKAGSKGRKQLEAPKEMKGLKALGAGAAASKALKKNESASPNRRLSFASRAAREELPPLSIVAKRPQSGKTVEGDAGLAVLDTGSACSSNASRSERGHGSKASSSISRRHSVSSSQKHETESNASRHASNPRRSISVKQPSEAGSSGHSVAPSRTSIKHPSGYDSGGGHNIAPSRLPPPPSHQHGSHAHSTAPSYRRGVNGYAEPSESNSRSLVSHVPQEEIEVEEGGGELHIVVVEEDLPVRRKGMREREAEVVKLSSKRGRTLYVVR